jgi:hypothetical protein
MIGAISLEKITKIDWFWTDSLCMLCMKTVIVSNLQVSPFALAAFSNSRMDLQLQVFVI